MEITVGNGIHQGKICRACLSTENNLREITEMDNDREHFINVYKACTTVDLSEINDLPLHICEKCILQVNEFNTFREMCLQSHSTIKTILNKSDKIVIDEGDEIFIFSNNISETVKLKCDDTVKKRNKRGRKRKDVDDNNPKCEICLQSFNDSLPLQQHYEAAHTTNDYSCALCQDAFMIPSLLTPHLRTHSKQEINNSDMRLFKCNRCESRYKTLLNLQVHVYSHLGLRPYKCEYCSKDFTKQVALMTHLSIHTGIRNFLCCECGKSCSTALHLKRHKISHSETRPYKCKFCPSSFPVPRDLTVHLRTHTGEKPYLCSTCGKAFRRANHLNVHRRIHTGEKPYQCSHCDKRFTQSGDRKAHERIHTGYKPYVCNVCDKKFNQTSALTTHMKKHCVQKFVKVESVLKEEPADVEVKHEPFFI